MEKKYFYAIWLIAVAVGCQTSDMEKEDASSSQGQVDYVSPSDHASKVEGIFQGYRFPTYPQTIRMCGQTVYYSSLGQYRAWEAFAAFSPQETVIQFYRRELGEKNFVSLDQGGMWRIEDAPAPGKGDSQNSQKTVKTLHVVGAEHHGLPYHCILPPHTKSVIVISISRPMARSNNVIPESELKDPW